ncbi:MAG: TonB-dependent receptor [Calditrichae bacterium]|nr:TonB-dependent receptor [Calditrichia bacterium]
MENGFVRLNFKFLNERNIFYLPIPLQNPDEPDEIIGFDPNFGTMTSNNMKFLSVPTPKGDNFEKDLEDGMNPVIKALGGEFNYEFEGGWGVKNVFRFTDIDEEFNAIFSVNNPILAYQHAQNQIDRANAQYPDLGATGFEYRDARTGEVLANTESEADALNGNGLAVTVGWWNVALPMSNFANDLQLSKSFGQHNLTAGFYHTDWKVRSLWYWQDVLADVRGGEEDDEPARVMDLVLTDEEGNTVAYVTRNGISQIGSFYNNYSLDARTNAGYLNDEFTLTDRLTVDGGIRYEVGEITGHVENRQNFDLSPEDEEMPNLADDNVTYGDRSYVTYQYDYDEFAWSIGANFKINEQTAVFGRVSDGFRTPDDQQFFDGGARARAEQNPDDVIEQVFQYEGGVKYSHPNLAVFLSLFGINFQNIPFSDEVIDPQTGNLQTEFRFADSKTIGAEAEANVKFGDFRVGFNGTYQMPEFDNYSFVSQNETEMLEGEDVSGDPVREGGQIVGYRYSFDGLEVRRIPKFFFDIRPSYTYDVFTFYGGYRFFGERFVDDANNVELPAWGAVSAGVSARLGNFTLAVNGHNLTNTIGLTEGNPRVGQVVGVEQDIYMARPILGRSFRGSLTYNF